MTDTILPHQMPSALSHAAEGMRVLSLDCFDTLLWRDCYAPTDLFAGLTKVNSGQRIVAEQNARKAAATMRQRSEVSLGEIYAQAMPNASAAEREQAIADELTLEAQSCFAFQPTVELMRAAKSAGHKVIIVSDTYLDATQLRRLIEQAAGAEVAGLIDRVFASSELGISKSQGLLAKALTAMKSKPQEFLHIGDNLKADFESARALGIPALHLAQFGAAAKQRMRFERACQQLTGELDCGVRGLMPYRAALAREEPVCEDAAANLGLTVLGPVFHAFDQWLRCEAEALAGQRGGTVHWLFMLRDGHLPHIVHQVGGEAESTARVEISRFVAIASSLTSREAYTNQMALEFGLNPSTLARQMLFTEAEIAKVTGFPKTEAEMIAASKVLHSELRSGQRQKLTRKRARALAERMIEHVRNAVNPQPGDTLMLVDLGYNGSAQDRVDTILADALNVHVAGRYLLLREKAATGLDKRGLFDARHFDAEWLEALCGNVAVIEQLATCELGSVVDFTDEGDPVRKASSVKGTQSAVRDAVQAGAMRFAEVAQQNPVIRASDENRERGWREAAAATLSRFMFLPFLPELDVLKSFEHDVNLGSERMVSLFDPDHAHEAMRRRGLFYMKGSSRMFLPAELAKEDISTRLSLLVQKRFGLGLSYTDSGAKPIALPVLYVGATNSARHMVEAYPTHEGFYSARLPVAPEAQAIALQIGTILEWVELTSVTIASVDSLAGKLENDRAPEELSTHFDGIKRHAIGILECTDPAAFVLVNLPLTSEQDGQQMIEVTFRPLRRRTNTSAPAKAGAKPQHTTLKDAAA